MRTSSAPTSRHVRSAPPARRTCSIVFTSSCCTRSCESRVRCGAEFADRRQRRRIDGELVAAREPDRAQRPQPILAHALLRVAHGAHDAGAQIGLSVKWIAHVPRARTKRDRIDREVAPREILVQARAELHLGVPAVRLHVATKGGDLVRNARSSSTLTVPNSIPTGIVRRFRRARAPDLAWPASRGPSPADRLRAARRGWRRRRTTPRIPPPRGVRRSRGRLGWDAAVRSRREAA